MARLRKHRVTVGHDVIQLHAKIAPLTVTGSTATFPLTSWKVSGLSVYIVNWDLHCRSPRQGTSQKAAQAGGCTRRAAPVSAILERSFRSFRRDFLRRHRKSIRTMPAEVTASTTFAPESPPRSSSKASDWSETLREMNLIPLGWIEALLLKASAKRGCQV